MRGKSCTPSASVLTSARASATNFATTRAGGGSTEVRARSSDGLSRHVRATGEGVGDARSRRNAGALLRARSQCAPNRRRLGRRAVEFGTSRDAPVRRTPGTAARSPRDRIPALSPTSSSRRPRSCGRSTVACAGAQRSARLGRDSAKKCAFSGGPANRPARDSLTSGSSRRKKPLEGFDPLYPKSVSTEPRKSSIGG